MNINLQIIADNLTHLRTTMYVHDKMPMAVHSIRLMGTNPMDITPGSVYIGKGKEMARSLNRKHLTNIICMGNSPAVQSFIADTSANVLVVESDCDITSVYNTVQDTFDFYNRCEKALTDAIIDGASLRKLIDLAYDFFGNPIFMTDSALMLLAHTCRGRENELDDGWRETISQGYTNIDIINDLRRANLLPYLDTVERAIFFRYEKSPLNTIMFNIFLNGTRVATINVVDLTNSLTEGHLFLAEHLGSMITSFMNRYMDHRHIRATPLEKLVLDQLGGITHSEQVIRHHLSLIGWNITDSYYLLKINPNEKDVKGGTIEYSAALVRKLFAGSFVLYYQNDLIVIINASRYRGSIDESFTTLEQFLRRRDFRGGISPRFDDFSTISDQYGLATAALQSGIATNGDQSLYFFGNYVLSHMIDTCSQTMNLKTLCHPDALKLHAYDRNHGTHFLQSLHAYLVNERSLVCAAAILGVHRNTLVYRLSKIGDMTNTDFDEPETRFHLILSYRILTHIDKAEGT